MAKVNNHSANGKQKRLQKLLDSICLRFEELKSDSNGSAALLQKIAVMDTDQMAFAENSSEQVGCETVLRNAISQARDPSVAEVLQNLNACLKDLTWKEDNFEFYPKGSDLGKRYRESNLHAQIIGPHGDLFQTDEFMLGFFHLGPWTLYKDHSHAALELYLNLSDGSEWRFNFGAWSKFDAGSLVCNPSKQIHATSVFETPFLSVFAWLSDINCLCEVCESDDHDQIEGHLLKSSLETKPA